MDESSEGRLSLAGLGGGVRRGLKREYVDAGVRTELDGVQKEDVGDEQTTSQRSASFSRRRRRVPARLCSPSRASQGRHDPQIYRLQTTDTTAPSPT